MVQGSEIGSLHCPHLMVMLLQCTGAFSHRSGLTSIQTKPPDFSASVRRGSEDHSTDSEDLLGVDDFYIIFLPNCCT